MQARKQASKQAIQKARQHQVSKQAGKPGRKQPCMHTYDRLQLHSAHASAKRCFDVAMNHELEA